MRNLSCWIIMLILPTALFSQSSAVDRFFDLYGDNPEYSVINIQGSILGLLSDDDSHKEEVKLNRLRVLSAPKHEGSINEVSLRSLGRRLRGESFEELMNVQSDGDKVMFMMNEKGGYIYEIVMLANGDENYTVISLTGKIPVDELENLDIDIDAEGWDELNGPQ